MINKIVVAILSLMWLSGAISEARLNESISECNTRYGEPLCNYDKGGLSFRTYDFSGKLIKVYFSHNKSFLEMIVIGPKRAYSNQDASKFGGACMMFVSGLLTTAYDFSDSQVKGLANMQRVSQLEAKSMIENGSTRVTFGVETNPNQNSMKATAIIVNTKSGVDTDALSSFVKESIASEHAGGF